MAMQYDVKAAYTASDAAMVPYSAGAHTVVIPGEGIRADNGVFCDTGDAAAVTIFYG